MTTGHLDVLEFYSRTLLPLTMSSPILNLLMIISEGGEKTGDISQILMADVELHHWVRLTVQRMGFGARAKTLEQRVHLIGQDRIRDLIVARDIERKFVPKDKTLDALAHAAGSSAAPAAPAAENEEKTEDDSADIIPNLPDFQNYLSYAIRAEQVAIGIRNSYPSLAYISGLLFDYCREFAKTRSYAGVLDPRLSNPEAFIEHAFLSGLRAGVVADRILQKVTIPHQRNAFAVAMVHNIGKVLLYIHDPIAFERSFLLSSGFKSEAGSSAKKISSEDAEFQVYDFDHAHAGSLYIGRLPFLRPLEKAIDFHHSGNLLKHSDPKMYALACVLFVSATLEKLYQRVRSEKPDIEDLKDRALTDRNEFKTLKLSEAEWTQIKSHYVLELMRAGL